MCRKIPSRVWVAVMIFWGTFLNYMFRTHYQISLLAMMKPRNNETVEDYGPRFDWPYEWEQQSISALFYGLMLISLPAGILVTFFGPFNILVGSSVIMAILSCFIVPMAYYVGPGGVFSMRFFVGMMVGLQYPAMHNLVSNWAPPVEKGKFLAFMMGNAIGSVVTMPSASVVIEGFGWSWSFYLLVFATSLFVTALYLLVADHPRNYRWIREEEVAMIEESHGASVSTEKKYKKPPYAKMFMSCPFYALIVAAFGDQYMIFLVMTIVPQYLKRIQGFHLKKSARIAALPQLLRFITAFLYGALNDFLIKKGVPKKYCRKGFTLFSHILTGGTLCLFSVIGSSSALAICLLVVMMPFHGAAVVTVLMNVQDLAPNWSGTCYGIMNFFGSIGGFIGPILVDKLTKENTIGQWAFVFTIGGVVGVITGIIFILFGSTEIQSWNQIEESGQGENIAK